MPTDEQRKKEQEALEERVLGPIRAIKKLLEPPPDNMLLAFIAVELTKKLLSEDVVDIILNTEDPEVEVTLTLLTKDLRRLL